MEGNLTGDVDVGDTVTIGQTEALFIADVSSYPFQAPACHRRFASVNKRHLPGLCAALVNMHRVITDIERDVGKMQRVVGKVLLDDIALVATANHKLAHAVK